MSRFIISDEWLKKLCESQGINYKRVSHVIIDAKAGEPVLMYITQFGDKGLVEEVAPPEVRPAKIAGVEQ